MVLHFTGLWGERDRRYKRLVISFAVFVEECHGNIASSTIVDCTVKRFSWRIVTWHSLSCHPLGFLSWAYLQGSLQGRRGKPSPCWRGAGRWPVGSARPSLPICG